MGKINWRRVFLGGLLACVVINLLGYVLGSLLLREGELRSALTVARPLSLWPRRTLSLALGGSVLGFFTDIIVTFLVGILVVWWYAAIRPRFGPGPKTAALAGFAFWLSASPVQVLLGGYVLQWSSHLVVTFDAIHLIQSVAAAVVGAWPYKE